MRMLVKIGLILVFYVFTGTTKGYSQFVPNRSFEYGTNELDVEYWQKNGSIGTIKRVKYHLFQGDTIWPWTGKYMLLFENKSGHPNPDASVNITFPCKNFTVNRFYYIANSYFVDSMRERLTGQFIKFNYNNGSQEAPQIVTLVVPPNNKWFAPKYKTWFYSNYSFEPITADSCYIQFGFNPLIGFSAESYALIDDLRIYGSAATSVSELVERIIRFYPNPIISYGVIESLRSGRIEIFDSFGRDILKQNIEAGETKIEMNAYAAGVYLIIFRDDAGRQAQLKVIKN